MNALQIIEAVRAHGGEVAAQDGQLVLRVKRGESFPDSLRSELHAHKAELLVALGTPLERTVAAVLADLRPHLSPSLQQLPDDRLLALVNWHIIAAWQKACARIGT